MTRQDIIDRNKTRMNIVALVFFLGILAAYGSQLSFLPLDERERYLMSIAGFSLGMFAYLLIRKENIAIALKVMQVVPMTPEEVEADKNKVRNDLLKRKSELVEKWADILDQARMTGYLCIRDVVVTTGVAPMDMIIFYVGDYQSFKMNFSTRPPHLGDHTVHYVTDNNELRNLTSRGYGITEYIEGKDYPEGTKFIVLDNDSTHSHMTQLYGIRRDQPRPGIRGGTGPMLG